MRYNVHLLLIAAASLMPAHAFSANIQQVAASGCAEGCCNMSDMAACNNCDWNNGSCDDGSYNYGNCNPCSSGAYCSTCNGNGQMCGPGRCTARSTWNAYGMDWCGRCGPIGTAARMHVPGAKQICWCCNTKAAPDSGWAPPARIPVNYTGGGFSSMYGNSGPFVGGAPMVYQPSDTTQLGFSYANVPTWQRDPSRIPSVPRPSQFHTRACPRGPRYGAYCSPRYNTGYMTGPTFYGAPVQGSSCPTCQPGMTAMPQSPRAIQMVQSRPVQNPSVNEFARQPPAPNRSIRTVSNTTQSTTVQRPAPRPTAVRNPSMSNSSQRPAPTKSGRSAARTKQPQQHSGWFGLRSLSEMEF